MRVCGVLFGLLILGCGGSVPAPAADGRLASSWEVTIPAGEVRSFDDERLFIELLRVENDSRCAIGVQCVWEGDATAVTSAWVESGEPTTIELHLNDRFSRSAVVGTYAIELLRIEPHPEEEVRIDPAEYRATVRVSR